MTGGFRGVPEDEQVQRLGRLAARALEAWGLAGAALEPIKYRENAVFAVRAADGGRSVLRVHRPAYRRDAEIRSEAAWMAALARDAGVPTPAMLPTPGGELVVTCSAEGVPEPRQCDRLAWVEGQPLGSLEAGVDLDDAGVRRTYRTVGAIAARIHAHAGAWTPPPEFARPRWDAETLVGERPTFGRFWELEPLEAPQLRALLAARDRVRRRLAGLGAAAQLIHGDLIPDNLLAEGETVRVIDFDDCGWSWTAFELVTSVFTLLVSGGFDDGVAGFLEGYREVRPFPDGELAFLPDLVMARALSYLGWPVGRPEIATQQRLVPFLAKAVTDLAQVYLASPPESGA